MKKSFEWATNITTASELAARMHLTPDQQKQMEAVLEQFPMSITPYYLSLVNFNNPKDPILKMCVPSPDEMDIGGSFDTSGEKNNTVMVGLQHKYAATAMILSTDQCAMYCRHCFRKRLVGGISDQEIASHFDEMMEYIGSHEEINNALVSGGDAFMNPNEVIEKYLKALCAVEHLDFIRFGTRIPVVYPMRISEDEELLSILKKYNQVKQINLVTHFNHPRELTEEALKAIRSIRNLGIAVRNQTVLLKGVNDNSQVLGELLKGLTNAGITPYYIFQCRPVTGVKSQFQVPLWEGYDIVEKAKAMQSGHGKCFKYVLSHEKGKIEILGYLDDKMLFKFHQAKKPEDLGRIFLKELEPGQAWLESGI